MIRSRRKDSTWLPLQLNVGIWHRIALSESVSERGSIKESGQGIPCESISWFSSLYFDAQQTRRACSLL